MINFPSGYAASTKFQLT